MRHSANAIFGSLADINERGLRFYRQGTATGASALARRGKVLLPLPEGEGRGEGEVHSRFTRVAVPTRRSPSPLIPLPWGEGNASFRQRNIWFLGRYQRKRITFLSPRNSNGRECLGPPRQSVTPSPRGRGPG